MKQRLVENVLVSAKYYRKTSPAQGGLKESVLHEGKVYEALAVYRFKFSRPEKKNLNGRIYGYRLWDLVIERMRGRSTFALMNHPAEDDPGNPKDIWAVARNIGYDDTKEFVEADFYILDCEWGRTAYAALKAGGEIGLSTSGLGEFLPDGVTVDPESFELERVADWVMEPSYEVFGRLDDKVNEAAERVAEKTEKTEEKKMDLSERKMKKIMEINLHKICESISDIPDPVERLGKAKELLEIYDEAELGASKQFLEKLAVEAEAAVASKMEKGGQYDALNEKITETNATLTESQKEIARLVKENGELNAKLKEALETLDSASEFSKNTEHILTEASSYRQNSVSYAEYAKLREYTRKVLASYTERKKELASAQRYVKALAEKLRKIINERKEKRDKAATSKKLDERKTKRVQEKKVLEEKRRAYEAEQEKIRRANPEVVQYFRDTLRIHPELMEYKDEFLKQRTLFEAQTLVLAKTQTRYDEVSLDEKRNPVSDLSVPISQKSHRRSIPEPELKIPKGFL